MSAATKLTIYFGERARVHGDGWLADALIDAFAAHRLATSLVLRGVEGFGGHHGLRTDRLLTMSEDLPLVAVAVDERERIAAALADAEALGPLRGLVTQERAELVRDEAEARAALAALGDAPTLQLTVYVGRREGPRDVVGLLAARGIAGATALLGVDGTRHGERRRARFFARNAEVPVMVIAVGDRDRIAAVLPELMASLPAPLLTLEPIAPAAPERWTKVMAYSSDRAAHQRLVAALRRDGAPGATTVSGFWGYRNSTPPHGDTILQVVRRVPLVTIVVAAPAAANERYAPLARELLGPDALVTMTGAG
jgi:PII-like signaling protein